MSSGLKLWVVDQLLGVCLFGKEAMSGQELCTMTGMSSFIGRGREAMGITSDFSLALPFIIKNGQGNKPEKQTVLHLVGS